MALPPTIADGTVTLTFPPAGVYYGYCKIADVLFEFSAIDAYTTLDHTTVAQEITYAAQEIQDQLNYVYLMPYTGADQGILLTLRDVNAKLAAANIMDRYFKGNVPNASPAAAMMRSWAELIVHDLLHGAIHWEFPFGDAIPQGQLPVYQTSRGASVTPNPNSGDASATPIFSIGRTHYRRDVM